MFNTKFFQLVSFFAYLTMFAYPTNFYVDKDATGLNNGTSWVNAWKTTAYIDWTKLKGGDVVYFNGGSSGKTYPKWVKTSGWGSRTGYVTFMPSYETGKNGGVTFYNSSTNDGHGSIFWINAQNAKIILKEFKVLNPNQNSANLDAVGLSNVSYITLDRLQITVGANGKAAHCIAVGGSSNVTIKNSILSVLNNSINTQQDGIILGRNSGDITIENNSIVLAGSFLSESVHRDGIQFWSKGEALGTVIIRNNFIYDACNVNSRSMSGIYANGVQGNFLIYNNVIVLGGSFGFTSGIAIEAGIYSNLTLKAKVFNNTIVSKQRQNYMLVFDYCDSLQVKNNLLYGLATGSQAPMNYRHLKNTSISDINGNQLYKAGGSTIEDVRITGKQYTFAQWKALGYEQNGKWDKPIFENVNGSGAAYFKLAAGSKGINEGVAINFFNKDKIGTIRPQGSKWDRGAFEYNPTLAKGDSISPELVSAETVDDYVLFQNYPNPFNPTTKINFKLKAGGYTTLKVFDILGNEIATLVNEAVEPGNHTVLFDATGLASGVYVYRIESPDFVDIKKMILLR